MSPDILCFISHVC